MENKKLPENICVNNLVNLPFEQLKLYLEVYKHHFDLFIKGLIVYLAVIGTLCGFIFSEKSTEETKIALSLFVASSSAIAFAGCIVSIYWVLWLKSEVESLSNELNIRPFALFGAVGVVGIVLVGSFLFGLGGIWSLISSMK